MLAFMVVNYDLPLMNERDSFGNKGDSRPDIETYIHRIGTSARGASLCLSLSLELGRVSLVRLS